MSSLFQSFCKLFFVVVVISINSIPIGFAQTAIVNLAAQATNECCKKYLFPFSAPAGMKNFVGLSGSFSLQSSKRAFSMALMTVRDIPTGTCPEHLEIFDTFPQLYGEHPTMRNLAGFITKKTDAGTSVMETQFTLPAAVPVSDCMVLILDGGSHIFSGDPVTVTSNISAIFSNAVPASPAPSIIPAGDEFNFLKQWSPSSLAFRSVIPITKHMKPLALYGNVSDAGPSRSPSTDPWSITNDYYLYRKCSVPSGRAGPGSYYESLPADALHLFSLTMSGVGMGTLERPLFKTFKNIEFNAGDCLVHLVRANTRRSINAEMQGYFLVQE